MQPEAASSTQSVGEPRCSPSAVLRIIVRQLTQEKHVLRPRCKLHVALWAIGLTENDARLTSRRLATTGGCSYWLCDGLRGTCNGHGLADRRWSRLNSSLGSWSGRSWCGLVGSENVGTSSTGGPQDSTRWSSDVHVGAHLRGHGSAFCVTLGSATKVCNYFVSFGVP